MPKRNNPTYPPMSALVPMVCYSDNDTGHQPPQQVFQGQPGQVSMGDYDAGNFGSQHPQQGSSGRGMNMNFSGPVHVNIEGIFNIFDGQIIRQEGQLPQAGATAGTSGNVVGNGFMAPPVQQTPPAPARAPRKRNPTKKEIAQQGTTQLGTSTNGGDASASGSHKHGLSSSF